MYNVLWFDDEPEKMLYFQEFCKDDYSLNLESYKTRRDGLVALDRDVEYWDAVILDAKMFNETEDEKIGLQGLREVIEKLRDISRRKAIPYFIFTGQPDLVSDANFTEIFGDFYRKGDKVEWVRLCDTMLSAIKATKENQIKAKYQDVFDALASMRLPQETESILLNILLPLHYPDEYSGFISVNYYTRLRKVVEYLFRAFHRVGLVPDQCVLGGNVNLNQCSLYLAGCIQR
jgi:response regulator RpfG family c-di-GMP phosphodiesterase